jgi:hypothetical protein
LPDPWKESISISIYKKDDKTDCNNYHGTSLLSTSYNILLTILLSRISPYIVEVIGDQQCRFQCNRSKATGEKWHYKETEHQLFTDFKKAYDSVWWEVLHSILTEFGVIMKLVQLIKICFNETYSKVCIGKHFSAMKNAVFWDMTSYGSHKNTVPSYVRFELADSLHPDDGGDTFSRNDKFLQEPHGVTSQTMAFFIVTAVKTKYYSFLLDLLFKMV